MVELATISPQDITMLVIFFIFMGVMVIACKILSYVEFGPKDEQKMFALIALDLALVMLCVGIGAILGDNKKEYKIITISEDTPYQEVVETYEVIDHVDSVYFVRDKKE